MFICIPHAGYHADHHFFRQGLTPSAAGRPKPIVSSPPELIQRRFIERVIEYTKIWCCPTSDVVTYASPFVRRQRVSPPPGFNAFAFRVIFLRHRARQISHSPPPVANIILWRLDGASCQQSSICLQYRAARSTDISVNRFDMDAGSSSMCNTVAFGQFSEIIRRAKQTNRTPTAKITSARCMVILAS